MSHEDIIRAWKDAEYRMSLSKEERAQLPENPAGLIELMDGEMVLVGGGYCPPGESECTWQADICPKPGLPEPIEPPPTCCGPDTSCCSF
jgi:mersacidin/lichenicidin family type 2 lantibiotic